MNERCAQYAELNVKTLRLIREPESVVRKQRIPRLPDLNPILHIETHDGGIVEQAQEAQLTHAAQNNIGLLLEVIQPVDSRGCQSLIHAVGVKTQSQSKAGGFEIL